MDIKNRIKRVRIDNGLSQAEFAIKIGIKQGGISAIENGTRGITDRVIKDICREFGVSEEWLREGNGSMYKKENVEFLDLIISKERELDDIDKHIIMEYLKLDPVQREAIKALIKRMAV